MLWVWLIMAILAWVIATEYEKNHGKKLGMSAWGWFALGILFGFATIIVELIMYAAKRGEHA